MFLLLFLFIAFLSITFALLNSFALSSTYSDMSGWGRGSDVHTCPECLKPLVAYNEEDEICECQGEDDERC